MVKLVIKCPLIFVSRIITGFPIIFQRLLNWENEHHAAMSNPPPFNEKTIQDELEKTLPNSNGKCT
jgi:hypothetical protein